VIYAPFFTYQPLLIALDKFGAVFPGQCPHKYESCWLPLREPYVGPVSVDCVAVLVSFPSMLCTPITVRCLDAMIGRMHGSRAVQTARSPAFVAIVVLALLPRASLAICQHFCSGHGYCLLDQSCRCFRDWTGGDCSRRKWWIASECWH
jgi:hypothetical protein